jgi:hypothetical protein
MMDLGERTAGYGSSSAIAEAPVAWPVYGKSRRPVVGDDLDAALVAWLRERLPAVWAAAGTAHR